MAKERIRKLARRLNLEIDDMVGLLGEIGHGRYRLPDDILPENVVQDLERALKRRQAAPAPRPVTLVRPSAPAPASVRPAPRPVEPLPTAFPEEPTLNAALQEYLAAQPLAQLKKNLPPAPGKEKEKAPAQPPARSTEEMLRESLGAEIRQRRLLSEALDQVRAELNQWVHSSTARERAMNAAHEEATREAEAARLALLERIGVLEARAEALRIEIEQVTEGDRQVRRELELAHALHKEELVARQVAEGRVAQLERRLKEIEVRAEPPAPRAPVFPTVISGEAGGITPLDELFEQRGLTRPAEVQGAFQALLREETYYDTMETLATAQPAALRNLLRRRLALLCENCDEPAGTVGVRVEPSGRCEVCRGSAVAQAAQVFLAACQARGVTRVNVVGGSPRYLSELRHLLGSSIKLRGIEGTAQMDGRRARQQVDGADLTIVWGRTILKHKVSNLYVDLNDPRVVQVVHRGIGGMLRLAAEALEHRWNRVAQR